MTKKLRVLSLDGGGVRGIVSCCVLLHVEQLIREVTGDRYASIADHFDLVCGTSTGGIIAAGLLCPASPGSTAPRYDVDTILRLYMERSDDIFYIPIWRTISTVSGLSDTKYPVEGLEEVLSDYFEDLTLSELLKPCLLPSFDMKNWRPHFFRQARAKDDPGYNYFVKDALRATAAAPTYFEPARIKSFDNTVYTLIDGGLVANNPAMIGYTEAHSMGEFADTDIIILSIGTGSYSKTYSYREIQNWGPISWLRPTLDISLNDFVTDYELQQLYNAPHTKSLRNYLRVQAVIPDEHSALDDATKLHLERLLGYGQETAKLYTHELRSMVKYLVESAS